MRRDQQQEQTGSVSTSNLDLIEVAERAASWFKDQLSGLSGANARRYVAERGLKPETIERFGLGYAPDGNRLKAALKDAGEERLLEVGLIGRAEDRDESYDRFRNRLIFPIRDPRGRVVGFGGRVLGDGQPKYLNSPDTPLFDKGRLLYNFDQAGPAARKSGRLFVVEGYLDVIALSQADIPEAVAPLGTALTEQQLQLLWRVVPEPVLCFDGDKAGRSAAVRAARRALPLLQPGCSLSILTLPAGQDPDDLVREAGGEAFLKLAASAEPLHEFVWNSVVESGDSSTPERRAALLQTLRTLSASIEHPEIRRWYGDQLQARYRQAFMATARAERSRPVQPLPRVSPDMGVRIALSAMIRFPWIINTHRTALARLAIHDPELAQLRQAILDAGEAPDIDVRLAELVEEKSLTDLVAGLPRLRTEPAADQLAHALEAMTVAR